MSKLGLVSDMEAQNDALPLYARLSRPPRDPTKWVVRIFAFIGLLFIIEKSASVYMLQQPDHLSSLAHSLHQHPTNLSTHPIDEAMTHNVHEGSTTDEFGTKAIIIASQAKDNTSWVYENFPDWEVNMYVVDDDKADLTILKQGAHEAAVYLTYIINHYYNLPDIMVFNHAKRFQWHNDDPMFDGVPSIRNLRMQHVVDEGYVSLRCQWQFGCPTSDLMRPGHSDGMFETGGTFAEVYQDWFPERPLPNATGAGCCAQFAVTKEQVQLRPVHTYEKIRQWVWSTQRTPEISGRILEYAWHIIFSKEDILCPTAEDCYCKKFGLCNLTCPDASGCDGRWYILPYWISIPEDWPSHSGEQMFFKPYGWWQEWYPNQTFGLDWMDPINLGEQKPVAIDPPKPAEIEAPEPAKVDAPKPAEIEAPKPAKVKAPKPAEIDVPTPPNETVSAGEEPAIPKPTVKNVAPDVPGPDMAEMAKEVAQEKAKELADEVKGA